MSARRRGRGEGSICQRPDGRWMGRVDLGWRDGKRIAWMKFTEDRVLEERASEV